MSGPVSPPLTVAESDGTPTVRPVNTIAFNSADFTVTDQGGATVRIDVNPGGGTSLTESFVGFGDSSNLLTGSSKFTYNDTAGSEQLKLTGTGVTDCGILLENTDTGSTSAPDLVLFRNVPGADNDFIGRMDFRGQDDAGNDVNYALVSGKIQDASQDAGRFAVFVSGNASLNTDDSQFMIFGRTSLSGNPGLVSINNSARSDVDFRVSGDTNANLIRTDASLDGVGIGTAPPSGHGGVTVRMTVKGDDDDIALMLQNDGTDADDGPEMVFYRNSSSPAADDLLGRIRFDGEDSGDNIHTYFRMTNAIKDPTDASEDGRFLFESRAGGFLIETMRFEGDDVIFNNNATNSVDVKILGDNDTILFSDASQDNLGVGTASPENGALLHIKNDGSKASTVLVESTDNDTSVGPVINMRRKNADGAATDGDNLGQIQFVGLDDIGGLETYAKIRATAADTHSVNAEGALEITNLYDGATINSLRIGPINDGGSANNAVDVNPDSSASCDFRVRGDSVSNMLYCDVSSDNIGIHTFPRSGGSELQVNGAAEFLSFYGTKGAATVTLSNEEGFNSFITLTYDAGAQAITLPTAVNGMKITLARQQATNAPTVVAATGEKINGVTAPSTVTMGAQYSVIVLHGITGTGWIAYEPAVAA